MDISGRTRQTLSMRLIDREIAGKIARYYLVILGVSASLLLLENAPRVLAATTSLSHPLLASGLVLAGLVPEYLAIAGIFGIYVTGAMLAYRLVRRNELSGWSAAGISTLRITASFAVLALLNAAMIFAMLGWLQPRGAVMVATVDRDVAIGRYGAALESGRPSPIGKDGTLVFDSIDSETGMLQGVFARLPGRTISSRRAMVGAATGHATSILFLDGLVIEEARKGAAAREASIVQFDRMNLVVPEDGKVTSISELEPFQKLAELPDLLTLSGDAANPADMRQTARAEALYRMALPLLSLLLAWLGFILGLPDRTATSIFATGFGLCFIVLVLRFADLVRTLANGHALLTYIGLLVSTAGVCKVVTELNRRLSMGFIDHALVRAYRRLLARFGRAH